MIIHLSAGPTAAAGESLDVFVGEALELHAHERAAAFGFGDDVLQRYLAANNGDGVAAQKAMRATHVRRPHNEQSLMCVYCILHVALCNNFR